MMQSKFSRTNVFYSESKEVVEVSFQTENLRTAIEKLDGYLESDCQTVVTLCDSIVLPAQYSREIWQDYTDDYFEHDGADLIKAALIEKELSSISSKDQGYINDLRAVRIEEAKQLAGR